MKDNIFVGRKEFASRQKDGWYLIWQFCMFNLKSCCLSLFGINAFYYMKAKRKQALHLY